MSNHLSKYTLEHAPSSHLSLVVLFIIAMALVIGITQFIATPLADEPTYELTLREGFTR